MGTSYFQIGASPSYLSGKFCKEYKQNNRANQRDTPLTLRLPHGRGSFILKPGLLGSSRNLPRADSASGLSRAGKPRSTAGKVHAASKAAAGRREGRVPNQSRRTPAATGRRPSANCSAGFRERVAAPAQPPGPDGQRECSHPSVARLRGPRRVPAPRHEPGSPSGLPSARPAPPEPGVLHSGRARGGNPWPRGGQRPASSSSRQSRPRPTTHRPPPKPARLPACVRQRPLVSAPHLRRAPAPSAPPGPAVYTGNDVSGPAPPPPQADAGAAADRAIWRRPLLREPGGGGALDLLS